MNKLQNTTPVIDYKTYSVPHNYQHSGTQTFFMTRDELMEYLKKRSEAHSLALTHSNRRVRW